MVVAELAPKPVSAGAISPELGTFFLAEMFTGGQPDELVVSVGEFTFVAIVTETDGRVFFAEFCFVFEGVCSGEGVKIVLIVPFFTTIALSGRIGTKID